MAKVLHTCSGCVPIDASIIDTYIALTNMVDLHKGDPGKSAYQVAVDQGYVGTEDEWLASLKGDTPNISIGTVSTVEPGTPASATITGTPDEPILNLALPKGAVGATPNFTVGEVTTGQPGTPVVVTITGTAAAPVLNVQIPQGVQGNTGSSVDYPFELVNNATTDDATKASTAAVAKGLKDDITQLEAEASPLFLRNNKNYIQREGDLSIVQSYSFKDDGTYGTGTSYYHADVLVYPGEVVEVTGNATNGTRIAFVSDLDCPDSGSSYGLVSGTFTTIAANETKRLAVPSAARAMKVYLGSLSDGVYTYKPTSLYIYRAIGTIVTPSAIRMDRYQISSSKYAESDSGHGWCFPVEKGKTYTLRVSGASSGTKYMELTSCLPYKGLSSSYSTFTKDSVCFTRTADNDGVWTVFKSSGSAFTADFAEVESTLVEDAETKAVAKVLNYGEVNVRDLPRLNFYIASSSGVWTASSTYKCVIYPVTPGQLIRVIPPTGGTSIIYWLTTNATPSDGSLPSCPEGHLERITPDVEMILLVPTGAAYVYVYMGAGFVPAFFGIGSTENEDSQASETAESAHNQDFCAYLDKEAILSKGRGYFFNDTYDTETSYVDTSYIDQKLLDVPDGKHFLFITDSHVDYANNIGFRQDAIPVVKYVRDRLGIPNVIFGGDCIGGVKPRYQAAKILSLWAGKMFDSFGSNFLWVMGNHDANDPNGTREETISDVEIYKRTTRFMKGYGKAVFPEKLLGIIGTADNLVDNAGNAMTAEQKIEFKAWANLNYYYDDELQKIRYIVLETGDCGNTMNDIFGVSGDSQNSLMTVAYFIVEAMKTIPAGYDLVMVGHWFTNNGAFWKHVFYKLCAAYKNKQSVNVNFTPLTYHHPSVEPIVMATFDNPASLSAITVDFSSNLGSGRIFAIGGHVHYDRAMVKAYVSDNDDVAVTGFPLSTDTTPQSMEYTDNDILQIVCDRSCAIGKGSSVPATGYSYPNDSSYTPVADGGVVRLGTVKEVLFDVVTITDDNRVVITRFGAEGPYVRDYILPMMGESE